MLLFLLLLFIYLFLLNWIIWLLKSTLETINKRTQEDENSRHNERNAGPLVGCAIKQLSHRHPHSHDDRDKGHNEGHKEPNSDLLPDGPVVEVQAAVVVKDVVVGRDVDEEQSDGPDDDGEPLVPLYMDRIDLTVASTRWSTCSKILLGADDSPINPYPESNGVLK